MSHPRGVSGLTSAHYSSHYSRPAAASVSPVDNNQSNVADLRTSPQAILNSKLIPRDYLTPRQNASTKQSGAAAEHTSPAIIQSDWRAQTHNNQPDVGLRSTPTPTTTASGKDTPDSDFLGYDDLRLVGTRSPEYTTSSASSKRPVPKPDSPTLHLDNNPLQVVMPRASSIDSAISSVSNVSVHRTNTDFQDPSPASVRQLIATSGNIEKLVTHLLREKGSVSTQNAQLWKLVEKQRALLLGLNKDLERATKERDRYKKKVKDLQQVTSTSQKTGQTHEEVGQTDMYLQTSHQSKSQPRFQDLRSPMDPAMMPRPLHSRENSRSQIRSDSVEAGQRKGRTDSGERSGSRPTLHRNLTDSSDNYQPSSILAEATPSNDQTLKTAQSTRKAPPKPLKLGQYKDGSVAAVQNSATGELSLVDEEPERGRRRTREDDDREREISAMQAEEARSRSKKESKSSTRPSANKTAALDEHKEQTVVVVSPPGLPLSPRPQHAQGLLSPGLQAPSLQDRSIAGALKSPGLPMSPRPMHNPAAFTNSLPLSPRAGLPNMPLSPRGPKHPFSIPPDSAAQTIGSTAQSLSRKSTQGSQSSGAPSDTDRLQKYEMPTSEPPQIYRGLVVASYPNLLLPPNALPSILVRVSSSRLRQSRNSVLGLKSQEDSVVFSLSVISRSSGSELWRLEKIPSSLPQLEQHLKSRCPDLPKMPDRKLFAAHSPAHLDARRRAIDEYFDALLDIHVDEQAAVMICRFLSTDVLDPDMPEPRSKTISGDSPINHIAKAIKTGYLTKKGKNFGGWKSRFFVLEGYELRYYESASGSHLGTIKVQNAQIGKPKQDDTKDDDSEGQFRHAFLIQEPKKKDATSYIRHVLCAESDQERDEWVTVLLRCSEGNFNDAQSIISKRSNSCAREEFSIKEIHSNSPTPTTASSNQDSPAQENNLREGRNPHAGISGPINGAVIKDTTIWGNKQPQSVPLLQQPSKDARDKSYKMSSIFGFKKSDTSPNSSADNKPKPRILRHNGYVRPVFGLPLAEAVEFCAPFHIDIDLPAVVYRSIEYLRFRNAASEEGLFRLSGSNSTVRMLKERFNTEGDVDLVAEDEYHDVHAVASLFKSYLRELPSSILTRELHIEFMKVLELTDQTEKIAAFNVLVRRLPPVNFLLLKELCRYLLEVTQSADKNKMSVRNIGIVFSPTLNIPPPVFNLFLNEFHVIFEQQGTPDESVRHVEVATTTLAPTDVRSPRNQSFAPLPTPSHHQTTFPGLPSHPHDRGTAVGPGDFGFVPVQQSYESGNYVSHPQERPPNPPQPAINVPGDAAYNSLNGMLAPQNPAMTKAARRESSLMFSHTT